MQARSEKAGPRWSQTQRLAFIEMRLQYEGRINRTDLMSFFGISAPQASADLGVYQGMAPENLAYDPRLRLYAAQPLFKPVFSHTAATAYLDELNRLARSVVDSRESFVGFVPPTGVVATPSRAIQSDVIAILVQSIRDARALRVRYQSMDRATPKRLLVSPHAFGFDGLRWHIRAWCHQRSLFRDFAIGRLDVDGVDAHAQPVNPDLDVGWATFVSVQLIPHPRLSASQRDMVMRDYDMKDGGKELSCRKAMLFYTLRHLNLQELNVDANPASQHVVVSNREEVKRWMDEDRAGNSNDLRATPQNSGVHLQSSKPEAP